MFGIKQTPPQDKLKFTLDFQLVRATEDLLAEVLSSGYEGYVKIIAKLKQGDRGGEVVLDVKLERIGSELHKTTPPKGSYDAIFHVVQGKGARRIAV